MNEFTFKVDKKSNGYLAQDFLLKVGVSKEIIKNYAEMYFAEG